MLDAPGERLSPAVRRALAAVWLGLAGLTIAFLAGELFLRIRWDRAWKAAERFRTGNVFFANSMELNAGDRKLWHKPWRKYEPGARSELRVGGERFVIEINRLGYRTREFSPEKPPGTVRVLCIGGSTTVAGRTNDETYPALLEAKLKQRWPGLPIEVLNLGVSGVNSEDWLGWLDKLLSFDPDVIVQYEAINDIAWLHLPRYAARHPWRRRLHDSLLLERLLGFDPAALEPDIRGTLRRFEEMDQRSRERGVSYLTATFAAPAIERAPEEFRQHLETSVAFWTRHFPLRSWATYAAILARHNALLIEFTARHHIDRVLVHERLTDPALFIDACHFTPAGIDLLAETFLDPVADLVEDRPAFKRWAEGRPRGTLVRPLL
jgi:lysophospholipase L1-like esterase